MVDARSRILATGEIGRLIGVLDRESSPLGPIADWSDALLATVGVMLPSGAEIVLFWGAEY